MPVSVETSSAYVLSKGTPSPKEFVLPNTHIDSASFWNSLLAL
jgi:hypothetical protein